MKGENNDNIYLLSPNGVTPIACKTKTINKQKEN